MTGCQLTRRTLNLASVDRWRNGSTAELSRLVIIGIVRIQSNGDFITRNCQIIVSINSQKATGSTIRIVLPHALDRTKRLSAEPKCQGPATSTNQSLSVLEAWKMASKRSRATFEADQALKPPYAFYGTPLPPLDSEIRDDGSYTPVWNQVVTDERGRRRLHGAFTGGFSAG